jgi:hypothetical protein
MEMMVAAPGKSTFPHIAFSGPCVSRNCRSLGISTSAAFHICVTLHKSPSPSRTPPTGLSSTAGKTPQSFPAKSLNPSASSEFPSITWDVPLVSSIIVGIARKGKQKIRLTGAGESSIRHLKRQKWRK